MELPLWLVVEIHCLPCLFSVLLVEQLHFGDHLLSVWLGLGSWLGLELGLGLGQGPTVYLLNNRC